MKPAWDKLGDEFKDHDKVVIMDVDCTSDGGKSVCQDAGVQGYPTIKSFFGSDEGEDYQGGRDFDALKKHVEDNMMKAGCSDAARDGCSEDQIKLLDEYKQLSTDERKAKIEALAQEGKDAQKHFDDELEKLQNTYKQLQADLEATTKEIAPKKGMLKSFDKKAPKADL